MKTKKTRERVVFVVDAVDFDINCGRLVDGTSAPGTKLVKFKHGRRSVEVPLLRCHDTLEEAKAALLKRLHRYAEYIKELEFDEDIFVVA